jgi:pilus assembly protein Flp/PilA
MFSLFHRSRLVPLLTAFLHDESGDDLIEYALLAALVGIVGVLTFNTMSGKMGTAYSNWNSTAKSSWVPCPPGGCTTP